MISFSLARQASPYQAGTSSHVESLIPQTQERTTLDELFHMTSCPSAEFTSIVESFRVTRGQHVDHGSSSSAAPPLPPPLASDSLLRQTQRPDTDPDPPSTKSTCIRYSSRRSSIATTPGRPHRATRPPPCGTGGHIHPRGDCQ
ncbi:hypothetical protein PIB30_054230 [Stylosanthes scabra]|uniref:Uncharacterized protein n=1 Tax=Stylosanthes scabra TaxID=79078 RepID=A0ABU6WKQ5_9FABA|nr:hypothetical protein [Stylosanthes scabra]